MQDDKLQNQGSGYVPDTDVNGMRKTFVTPEFIDTSPAKRGNIEPKYPWKTIKVGESFPILHSEMKKTSVYPFVNRSGKKYNKKFKITDQPGYGCWLISCIEYKPTNIIEAIEEERRQKGSE